GSGCGDSGADNAAAAAHQFGRADGLERGSAGAVPAAWTRGCGEDRAAAGTACASAAAVGFRRDSARDAPSLSPVALRGEAGSDPPGDARGSDWGGCGGGVSGRTGGTVRAGA